MSHNVYSGKCSTPIQDIVTHPKNELQKTIKLYSQNHWISRLHRISGAAIVVSGAVLLGVCALRILGVA